MATDVTRSNRKCYAEALGDCEGPLSKEHYVSKKLLEWLNTNGRIRVSGLPLLADAPSDSPKSLTARVLCTRHNSLLSALDDEASGYIMAFFDLRQGLEDATITSGTIRTFGAR